MRVDSDKAFNQLMNNGRLATLRKYPYREGQRIRIYHRGRYVGEAVVEKVIPSDALFFLNGKHVDKIVELSGFASVGEWLEEARRLYKSTKIPPYLVIIRPAKKENNNARYYVVIRELDGTTEIWCGDESLERIKKIIEIKKVMGLLKQARIYRYQGRKRVLEEVIQ